MTIAQTMVPELKIEVGLTRGLIARIPPDKLDFTPGHGLHTIGWNAYHVVDIIGWTNGTLETSGFDISTFDSEQAAAAVRSVTTSGLLSQLDENCKKAVAVLEKTDDAQLAEPWSMTMGGEVLWSMSKHDVLRKWVFSHEAHHRGVLSTLLRLAGVEHKSIYEE